MSTVRQGEAVNGCTEERKEIRRIKYLLFIYIYILYIHVWVVELIRVDELGGALGAEVMEEVLV